MTIRIRSFLVLILVVTAGLRSASAQAASMPSLPPLPHTVGMSGSDVDLIESGIAAFGHRDLRAARDDFRGALAIRSQTAIANFNLGVTEFQLGDRAAGERAMQLGLRLADEHGMSASPQAAAMRLIARALNVDLG